MFRIYYVQNHVSILSLQMFPVSDIHFFSICITSNKVCIAKLLFRQFIISYVQSHFSSSPSPPKCSPNPSIPILDLTVSMINRNISQKYSLFAMSPKLSCLVIIVFLINLSLQLEIVKKVQDGKKTVLVDGRKISM